MSVFMSITLRDGFNVMFAVTVVVRRFLPSSGFAFVSSTDLWPSPVLLMKKTSGRFSSFCCHVLFLYSSPSGIAARKGGGLSFYDDD